MPLICHLAGVELPRLAEAYGMARGMLAGSIDSAAQVLIRGLEMPWRDVSEPAGAHWSTTYLAELPARMAMERNHREFAGFLEHAAAVLKSRLSAGHPLSASTIVELKQKLASGDLDEINERDFTAMLAADIRVSEATNAISTRAIGLAMAKCASVLKTGSAEQALGLALLVCLQEGDLEGAEEIGKLWVQSSAQLSYLPSG